MREWGPSRLKREALGDGDLTSSPIPSRKDMMRYMKLTLSLIRMSLGRGQVGFPGEGDEFHSSRGHIVDYLSYAASSPVLS